MADRKISELTNITGANLADADEFVIVDASADETKALTFAELRAGLDTATGFVRITGDTMTGNLNITKDSGYASIELLGPSGGFIDFRDSTAEDHDARIISTGSTFDLTSVNTPIRLNVAGGYRAQVTQGLTVNTNGNDSDTVISGNNLTNLFYADAGNDRIGLGTDQPDALLHLSKQNFSTTSVNNSIRITDTDAAVSAQQITGQIEFETSTSTDPGVVSKIVSLTDTGASGTSNGNLLFYTGENATGLTERVRVTSTGRMGVGTGSPSAKFHSADTVSIGSDLNDYKIFGVIQGHVGNITAVDFVNLRTSQGGTDWTTAATRIQHRVDSTEQGYLQFNGASGQGSVAIGSGSNAGGYHTITENVRFTTTGVYFNQLENNRDFKVKSQNQANMFLVDADTDKIHIGGSNGSYDANRLNIRGPSVVPGGTNGNVAIYSTDSMTSGVGGSLALGGRYTSSGTYYMFGGIQAVKTNATSGQSNGTLKLYYVNNSNGTVPYHTANQSDIKFNEDQNDTNFKVSSSGTANMLFVDAGANSVGINKAPSSSYKLDISGDMRLTGTAGTIRLEADDTSLSAEQSIGRLEMYANDTSSNGTGVAGFIESVAIDQYGVNTALSFGVRQSGSSVAQERLRLQRLGQVIHSPIDGGHFEVNAGGVDADFRVQSDNKTHFFFLEAEANSVHFANSSSSGQYNGTGANGIAFQNVGANGQYVTIQNGSDANMYLTKVSGYTDNRIMQFAIGGTTRGAIRVDNSGTTYETTSDRRLKTDITPITDGTEKLMAMNPVRHKWIAEPDADAVHGFIAQEMQSIVPEAVNGTDGGDEMMSMDYGRITPVLVAALQDAHKKIEALEARLIELEDK